MEENGGISDQMFYCGPVGAAFDYNEFILPYVGVAIMFFSVVYSRFAQHPLHLTTLDMISRDLPSLLINLVYSLGRRSSLLFFPSVSPLFVLNNEQLRNVGWQCRGSWDQRRSTRFWHRRNKEIVMPAFLFPYWYSVFPIQSKSKVNNNGFPLFYRRFTYWRRWAGRRAEGASKRTRRHGLQLQPLSRRFLSGFHVHHDDANRMAEVKLVFLLVVTNADFNFSFSIEQTRTK